MKFAEKLKKAMQELGLNQRQVVTLTGKSKGSVSQYLSGKQIPSEDVQSAIATSLGLASDYFTGMDQELQVMPQLEIRDGVIPRLDVTKAAKLMGMNHNTVRKGLQQGVFPWGYAVHTSDNRWSYFINAKRFAEVEGMMDIVEDYQLDCRVYQTTRGKHFLFKNHQVTRNHTHVPLAIGLTADIKCGTRTSYSEKSSLKLVISLAFIAGTPGISTSFQRMRKSMIAG